MLGIIIQLLLSWGLLWLFEKKNLSVLGLMPTRRRMMELLVFLIVSMACCASGYLIKIINQYEVWKLNPKFSWSLVLNGAKWNINSVLFEELIFRGAIFYILLKKIGTVYSIAISAVSFGIYHWFSFGILGNISQMIPVFILTGITGVLYAYGYVRTASLYAVVGMHFGWNFTNNFIFSNGNIGDGILVLQKPAPTVTVSNFTYYVISFLPMISYWVINFLLLKYWKTETANTLLKKATIPS